MHIVRHGFEIVVFFVLVPPLGGSLNFALSKIQNYKYIFDFYWFLNIYFFVELNSSEFRGTSVWLFPIQLTVIIIND